MPSAFCIFIFFVTCTLWLGIKPPTCLAESVVRLPVTMEYFYTYPLIKRRDLSINDYFNTAFFQTGHSSSITKVASVSSLPTEELRGRNTLVPFYLPTGQGVGVEFGVSMPWSAKGAWRWRYLTIGSFDYHNGEDSFFRRHLGQVDAPNYLGWIDEDTLEGFTLSTVGAHVGVEWARYASHDAKQKTNQDNKDIKSTDFFLEPYLKIKAGIVYPLAFQYRTKSRLVVHKNQNNASKQVRGTTFSDANHLENHYVDRIEDYRVLLGYRVSYGMGMRFYLTQHFRSEWGIGVSVTYFSINGLHIKSIDTKEAIAQVDTARDVAGERTVIPKGQVLSSTTQEGQKDIQQSSGAWIIQPSLQLNFTYVF